MNNYMHKRLPLFFLALFLLTLSACGLKSPPQAQAASSSNKPLEMGTTPEPGNDGKPMPRPDGHMQSIVAANGVVYVGSDNGTLYALNAGDGTMRWQQKLNAPVTVSTVSNGTVYGSIEGAAFAFDAGSGARLWLHLIQGRIGGGGVVVGNDAVLMSTAVSPGAGGNGPYSIYALRKTDGSQLWQYTVASDTPGLLGVANDIVYAMNVANSATIPDEYVSGLQLATGHVLWRVHIEGTDGLVRGAPVVVNGIAYLITTQGALYALQATTGKQLWHVAGSAQQKAGIAGDAKAPVIANGVVYVNTDQGTYAYRATNGHLLWQKKATFFALPFIVQPVLSNGYVYVIANGGEVYALRAQDGSQVWQSTKTFTGNESLTAKDGLIYIDTAGAAYALREQDGSLAWQQPLDHHDNFSSDSTSMLVTEGSVYVSKDNGVVEALHASDGKVLWNYAIQEQSEPTGLAYSAIVTFTSATSYSQALKAITNLGLQLSIFCPMEWKSQESDNVFSNHQLTVAATVDSAPLWLDRLKAVSGVRDVQAMNAHSCPLERVDDSFLRLHLQQGGTFVRVTFAPTIRYDAALTLVDDLWFRIADPCYEQARAQGKKPTWQAQGQSGTFAQTHSFVLATTTLNSIHWLDQLHTAKGVVKVDAPLKVMC